LNGLAGDGGSVEILIVGENGENRLPPPAPDAELRRPR
jgi:hypothetical protein